MSATFPIPSQNFIEPLSASAMEAARRRQAQLAKPPGSLGRLEELSIQLAGIQGTAEIAIQKKVLLVFAADNGVVCEGVSSAPQSVSRIQADNIGLYRTGAGVLARQVGAWIHVYDVGLKEDACSGLVIPLKTVCGTENMAVGPAMERDTAVSAIQTGYQTACAACEEVDAVAIGEMGIGNTTTASAVLAALLGADPETVTGRGGGLTDDMLQHKIEVIRRALAVNRPDPEDPVDVLSKVGGLDLAAMCGAFLGCACARKPAVVDGFPCAAAALCAMRICPAVRDYMIPSHASAEPGFRLAMEALQLKPFLQLDMRLGEGSGALLAFPILDAACTVLRDMASFDNAGIDDSYLDEIRAQEDLS